MITTLQRHNDPMDAAPRHKKNAPLAYWGANGALDGRDERDQEKTKPPSGGAFGGFVYEARGKASCSLNLERRLQGTIA